MVEWYWQGKTEVLGEQSFSLPLAHKKYYGFWPGVEHRPPRREDSFLHHKDFLLCAQYMAKIITHQVKLYMIAYKHAVFEM
jgi:hypothetical protein